MRMRKAVRTALCGWFTLLSLLLLLLPPAAAAARELQSVPRVAAIATADAQATEAAADVLRNGGNAFDAAVAATAVLAVVEPFSSGLGGGGFYLLHRAVDGRQIVIDARESAPAAAAADMYLDARGRVIAEKSTDGPLAAAIPGIPAALDHLARNYGRLPLAVTLAPAVNLARNGFPVGEVYRRMAQVRLEALRRSPAASAAYLVGGEVPASGYVVRQVELADTLERLSQSGADAFYSGDLARRLVDGVRAAGGIWTDQDLASYRIVERAPLIGQYHDMRVTSVPPPSSGGTVLIETLNILAGLTFDPRQPAARKHLIVEAMRRAYRDRAEFLGDPDLVRVPVERLTSTAHADALRAGIAAGRATPSSALAPVAAPGTARAAGENTTHFSILDAEGNRVAATLSINTPFGSAYMPPGTGVVLNNEMDDFVAAPGQPNSYGLVGGQANAIAPGKRPLSSMTPTFVETSDRVGILGTPGGSRIISMVLLGVLEFEAGRPPKAWVSLPRFHHQYLPDRIEAEAGALNDIERAALERWGHEVLVLERQYGNMQAILWDRASGEVKAASDPRGEGTAAVLQ
ncbi:MAG: Glutathione hydrolase proenzyme [Gammaproteobacteria bacterium]|nr:Glutathione hydrolase proenzyme [Gammaproteobacteria bacterium]